MELTNSIACSSLTHLFNFYPLIEMWIIPLHTRQRRAGNGVSELHGCLYVVGEWMVFSSLIFYRTYNDSVTKQHRNITLHLGSSGISPKVCFCILQVHGLASLFTSSSFMFKTLPPCFYLGVASMSKVGDYIEIRHFFNVRTQIECALLQ